VHQSTTRLPRPHSGTRSGSVESYRSAHSHPHSPSLTSTSLIDEPSHRNTATPSPSREIPSISSKPSPTPASNHDPPHAPVLSIRDEPDGWSITLNKKIKPSMNVKLVDVLVYTEEVSCVRFSPDGYYLAVGLDSGQICIHDVRLGKRTWSAMHPFCPFECPFQSLMVAFLPNFHRRTFPLKGTAYGACLFLQIENTLPLDMGLLL